MISSLFFIASTAFLRAAFGEGSGMVYLEGLECEGDEDSLLECPMEVELGLSLCDHSRDAGVRCFGIDSFACNTERIKRNFVCSLQILISVQSIMEGVSRTAQTSFLAMSALAVMVLS